MPSRGEVQPLSLSGRFPYALASVQQRDAYPILCGGTGLYIESVLKGYNIPFVPQNPALRAQLKGKSLAELTELLAALKAKNGSKLHNTTDIDTAQRAIRAIEIEVGSSEKGAQAATQAEESKEETREKYIFGIDISREMRRKKITQRLAERLAGGMIEEVQGLLDSGLSAEDLIYYGLEYKYVTEYCLARISYDEMFTSLEIAIHQFAKRQMTWFRGMERRGFDIHWLPYSLSVGEKVEAMKSVLKEKKI